MHTGKKTQRLLSVLVTTSPKPYHALPGLKVLELHHAHQGPLM